VATEERVFKGMNAELGVSNEGVRIHTGLKYALRGQKVHGDKHIPWDGIAAVDYRQANALRKGYLQLTLRGGGEVKKLRSDENTVWWQVYQGKNGDFAEARDLILARIQPESEATKVCPDCAETIKAAAAVCRFCGHRFDS
jgi:hypothetical protein